MATSGIDIVPQSSVESKLRACGLLTLVHGVCQGWGVLEERIGAGNNLFKFDGNVLGISPSGFGICYVLEGAVGIMLVLAHARLLEALSVRTTHADFVCITYVRLDLVFILRVSIPHLSATASVVRTLLATHWIALCYRLFLWELMSSPMLPTHSL